MQNENIKAFIKADAAAVGAVVDAFEDGKISISEILSFIAPLTAVAEGVKNIKQVISEWKNSDAATMADTLAYAQSVITFKNPKTENKVEAGIGALIYIGAFFAVDEPDV